MKPEHVSKAYSLGFQQYQKDTRERSKYENPYNVRIDSASFFAWNDGWFQARDDHKKGKI